MSNVDTIVSKVLDMVAGETLDLELVINRLDTKLESMIEYDRLENELNSYRESLEAAQTEEEIENYSRYIEELEEELACL